MAGANIGMMDPAFFTGRKLIIQWLNDTFHMNVSKIEETASGAVACQILDAIYPGEMAMSKVRWDAKSSHEFIDHYKLIQRLLDKKGIDKHIEVERLVRAKYQDNLENMQWFKHFYESNYQGQPYDPLGRRAKGRNADAMPAFTTDAAALAAGAAAAGADTGRSAGGGHGGPPAAAAAQRAAAAVVGGAVSKADRAGGGAGGPGAKSPPHATAGGARTGGASGKASAIGDAAGSSPAAGGRHGGAAPSAAAATAAALQKRVGELTSENVDLRLAVESLEKERDFYFGKLRDIEILLQSYAGPDRPTADTIFKILYATEDDFVQPPPPPTHAQQAPPAHAATASSSAAAASAAVHAPSQPSPPSSSQPLQSPQLHSSGLLQPRESARDAPGAAAAAAADTSADAPGGAAAAASDAGPLSPGAAAEASYGGEDFDD